MIKIIKNTMEQPTQTMCGNCLSEFEFNYEDIRRIEDKNIWGAAQVRRYIVCPVCKKDCNLEKIVVTNKEGEK